MPIHIPPAACDRKQVGRAERRSSRFAASGRLTARPRRPARKRCRSCQGKGNVSCPKHRVGPPRKQRHRAGSMARRLL